MKRRLSIGLRLTLWYVTIFALAQAAFGLGMWLILKHNLYDIADDQLEAQINDVHQFLTALKPGVGNGDLQQRIVAMYSLQSSGEYLQIRGEDGEWVYRSPFLKQSGLLPAGAEQLREPIYETVQIGRGHFRFMTVSMVINGKSYVVQTGLHAGDFLRTLILFRRYLIFLAPLLLIFSSGVGYWLSRTALAPVDMLTQTARNITASNLGNRLRTPDSGDELQRLCETLNAMLSRIEQAFLRVSRFTADASHELRTPIALIRTEAEIALRKSRDEAEYREALEHILLEAEKTSTLIETLLSLARTDAGRETLDMQPVDLRELTQQVAHDWRPVMTKNNLQFRERLSISHCVVTGDKLALSRLLNILLDNAVKYTSTPGAIDLILEEVDRKAVIAIRDTGIGISQEDQPKIFERFYRADKARSRQLGGAGLGLAIAAWVIEQHRGEVAVLSSPGRGSTFSVRLPLQYDRSSLGG